MVRKPRWLRIARRLALDRWYPHLPLALAVLPFGVLLVLAATDRLLGETPLSIGIWKVERGINPFQHRPIVEFAQGVSLVATSVGLALRSRLAWLWCVALTVVSLALRVPPGEGDTPLLIYCAALLVVLVVFRRRFTSRTVISSGVFALAVLIMFLIWATLGTLRLGDQFEPPVRDLATALYVTVVTVSSVGFGDFVARSPEARFFMVSVILLGIVVGATALSTILVPLIAGRMREIIGGSEHVDRSNHYVIVGRSPLARNVALELEKRHQRVTLILERSTDEDFYHQRDVIVGDPTDLSVLRSAGVDRASGVLALSTTDADNGFVVLGVNELDPTIPTVAALNDPANEFRLQRTQPSMLLSLQALGGELLAMALTGEHVDVSMLTRVLKLHSEAPGMPPPPHPEDARAGTRLAGGGQPPQAGQGRSGSGDTG